jgi:hypothetical protein
VDVSCVGGFLCILRSVSLSSCVLLSSALQCHYARLWYLAVGNWHCVSCHEGESSYCLGFLSNVCALVVVSCEEIIMVCRVVLKPGLLLRCCLSYLAREIHVEYRILIFSPLSLSHCY